MSLSPSRWPPESSCYSRWVWQPPRPLFELLVGWSAQVLLALTFDFGTLDSGLTTLNSCDILEAHTTKDQPRWAGISPSGAGPTRQRDIWRPIGGMAWSAPSPAPGSCIKHQSPLWRATSGSRSRCLSESFAEIKSYSIHFFLSQDCPFWVQWY